MPSQSQGASMKKLFLASIALVALSVGGPAAAADMRAVYKAPPPVFGYDPWTGFYIGANIGGGWGDRNVDYAANDLVSFSLFTSLAGAPPPVSINTSGMLGGLQVGYNWQMGPAWLIGAEADIDWSGVKGSVSTNGTIGTIAPFANTVDVAEKVKWLGTVRARLGYLPTPNLLAFVTGGFAYGEVEHKGTYTSSLPTSGILIPVGYECTANVPCFSGSASDTAFGWTVGGGLEYAVARNLDDQGRISVRKLGKQICRRNGNGAPGPGNHTFVIHGQLQPNQLEHCSGRIELSLLNVEETFRMRPHGDGARCTGGV
jgi:outer membrane immunogenic protein